MSRPAMPPKPVPKPGKIKVYRAVFQYKALREDELNFEEGDVLYVPEGGSGDWLKATVNGKSGLIPANYVEESAESVSFPLHEAAKRGNLSFLNECLDNKVSVNGLDASGSTALYWAAHGGHSAIVSRLLGVGGVSVDGQNRLGDTPLHAAAWRGRSDALRLLLSAGANADRPNADGKTPRDLASDPDCAAVLRRRQSRPTDDKDAEEYLSDDED